MEKKALPDNLSPKQPSNGPSDIQSADDCITFISLSHYQMHKLVHDPQGFIKKVKSINRQAKKQIELNAFKQALSLLTQGEKILQYAAGSGKTIERDLIICILHNIASTYHKLWVLQKCLRYVEGLIFNLENHLHSLQNSVVSSNQQQQILAALHSLDIKRMLAVYCLRFCALNSQQQNHKQALVSSKKAIGYIRNILTFDEQYTKNLFRQQGDPRQLVELKHRLLLQVLEYQNSMNVRKQKQILKAAHFSLQIWNKNKQKNEKNCYSNYKFLKNYSIGDFMEFKPLEYHSKDDKLSEEEKKTQQFQSSIAFNLLLLSISFFSTSTEIRLNLADTHNQYYSQLERQNASQFIQAEIYHLLSIIVISAFLPFDILYIKHVLNSYSNYFNSGLVEYKTVEQQSYQRIIELISDNKYKSPLPGSTDIISSEEALPDLENNDYKLKDRFKQQLKHSRKNFRKSKNRLDKTQTKKSGSKNFSSLQSKSLIKEEKRNSRTKPTIKLQSKIKQKSKSRPKTKSKTVQKKSKEKEKYFFVKTTSKSKKKHGEEQVVSITKKLSPRKSKQHGLMKQIVGSEINKPRKKSILNHRMPSTKKTVNQYKSPKRRSNVYGFNY